MKRLIAVLLVLAVLAGIAARIAAERTAATPAFTGTVRIGFVAGLAGANAQGGREMLRAAQDLVDRVNSQGGVGGLRVELAATDDGNDPERAVAAARSLAADPSVVAVIGHNYSGASAAAAPVYAAAGLPAVTPASTSPGLGEASHGWMFRTIYDDDQQGDFLVSYAQQALGAAHLALVTVPDAYGARLDQVIRAAADRRHLPIVAAWRGDPGSAEGAAGLVAGLTGLPGDTVAVLLAHQGPATALVRAIRDAGLRTRLLAPDALGSIDFAHSFAGLPREEIEPGFYTNGLFVSVPFLADTANAEARGLIGRLEAAGGPLATWGAPYAYDAAKVLVEAMRRAGFGPGLPPAPRRAIRDQLVRMRAPGLGVPGATGLTWFDAQGNARKPVTVGQFAGRLISSLRQLRIEGAEAGEEARELPVVYTGILPRRIEPAGTGFDVDFDLWFRFQGEVPVEDVVITGALEPVTLGAPVETASVDGITYRRYRLHGRFQAFGDGARAARGRLGLAIGMHHRVLPQDRLIFVPDSVALTDLAGGGLVRQLRDSAVLPAGTTVTAATLGLDMVERSTLGNPELGPRGAPTVRLPGVSLAVELGPEIEGLRRRWLDDRAEAAALGLAMVLVILLLAEGRPPLARHPRQTLLLLGLVAGALLLVGESAVVQLLIELGGQQWIATAIRGFNLLWWAASAGLLLSAVRRLVWRPLEAAAGRPVPRVIKTFVAAIVGLLTVLGVLGNVFDRDVTGLVATSGVFAAVLGLALQSNIASVFSGIALNLERPIRPGDLAKIGDAPVAQVVDISWRSTKLKTFANTTLSIPNALVTAARIENFSYPENRYFISQILHFDPAHDPAVLTDLLYDALRLAPSVDGRERLGLMSVKFNGVDAQGARFLVTFDCTDRGLMNSQEHQVLISIHQTLRRAGVTLATQRQDVHVHEGPAEQLQPSRTPADLLDDMDLFRPLAGSDRERLAAGARRRVFAAGETVFAQGEPGRSLFLVAEGVVGVTLTLADGEARELARFGPGSFFGEMALLTGEARSTSIRTLGRTVLYEIDKAAIAPILDGNPELMERLSEVVAERQLNNGSVADQAGRYEDAHRSLSDRILGKVRSFFGAVRAGG